MPWDKEMRFWILLLAWPHFHWEAWVRVGPSWELGLLIYSKKGLDLTPAPSGWVSDSIQLFQIWGEPQRKKCIFHEIIPEKRWGTPTCEGKPFNGLWQGSGRGETVRTTVPAEGLRSLPQGLLQFFPKTSSNVSSDPKKITWPQGNALVPLKKKNNKGKTKKMFPFEPWICKTSLFLFVLLHMNRCSHTKVKFT